MGPRVPEVKKFGKSSSMQRQTGESRYWKRCQAGVEEGIYTVYSLVAKIIIPCIKMPCTPYVLLLTHTKLANMQCLGLFMHGGV